ncbi:Ig-like domain-containing protein [Verrucomicrobiales bacterium BCK34]|nr:Ig-like domain-containing protein [Verrucomicrobiales bacterium BCK34]
MTSIGGSAVSAGTPGVVVGSYGTITQAADGTYSYALDNGNTTVQALGVGETAVETFSYTADDGEGGSATATLSITITGTNDAPVANPSSGPGVYDDSDSIAEDAFPNSATGNVLSNDSDPDGDTLSVSAVNGTGANTGVPVAGSYGSITINSNGSYNYALNNNNATVQALGVGETATETFSYTASDGNGGSATASLTITITGTNDAPTANPSSGPGVYNDTDTVAEDTVAPITGDVLLNDSDPDGDTLSVSAVNGDAGKVGVAFDGSYGELTLNSNGSYSYELDNGNAAVQALGVGETAVETFSYIASDGQGGSATATLSITITGTNDAPVAIADTGSTTQGTTTLIDVLGNDTDPDTNDTLTVVSVVQPLTGGSVSITENKVRFDPGSDFDYLDDGETADVTFDYTVSDGMGGTDTATVTVTVTGADDPLVAVADFGSTTENAQLVLSVLANDLELDTTDKPLTVTAVSAPSLGSVSHDGTNITFDPGSDFDSLTSGESQDVTFNYTVTNQDGATDIETVTITVNGVNDAPETHADTLHTIEGVGRAVDVIANDSDAESTQLQVSHINGAAVGPNAPVILSSGATVSLMEDGRVYFNPNGRYADLDFGETATESFTYTVVDSEGGTATETVTVTIDGTDEEEVISGAYQVLSDQLYEIQLDPADESIVYVPIGDPLPFSFNSIAFNSNDNLIYATAQGSDAGLGVATKDIILISPLTGRVVGNIGQLLNDQGEAINDYAGAINSDINVYYVNGTSDSAGNTTYAIDLDPSSPTYLSVTGVGGLPGADYGVDPNTGLLWSVNGTTTYSLDPTSGVLTTYNNNGGVNGSGNPVSGTFGSMFSDGDGNIQVTANNGDGFFRVNTANGDLIRIADAPVSNSNDATGTLETALPSAQPFLFLDTDGSTGAPTARDAVRVYDPAGSSVSIADNDTSIADLDGDVISSAEIILKNPQSGDEFVTAGLPSGITASIATRGGYLVVTLSGDASQTDYASAIEAVRFQNSGGGAVLTDPRQITVTVTDENGVASNPASSTIFIGSSGGTAAFRDTQTEDGAFADSLHVHEDDNDVSTGGATLNLLTNDSDNPTTITGITQPPAGEGTVTNNGDGTVTFNPGNDFQYLTDGETASTTFTYTTSTGETETVTMTIHGANDPIVAVADSAMAPADEVTTIDVLANDSDPDSVDQPLTITATTQPPKGSVTTDGSHVFFNPGSDFAGLAPGATEVVTFIYTVSNASGEVENELVTVTVTGPNDDPVAINDIGAVNEDATSSVGALAGVLSNDTDPDVGAVLTVAAVRTGAEAASGTAGTVGASLVGNYGTLTLAADGSYTYVADQAAADALANGATANDVFTYTVSDGFGGSDTAELSITVTGTNDAPVASAESGTVKEDVTPTASGQLDATDEEGDTLAFSRNSTGTPGTEAGDNGYGDFTINANGTWSYSLDNANGSVNGLAVGETITDTITYRATAGGGTDTETITVTIEGTNDGPVAVNDSYSVSKGSTVTIDPRSNDTDVDGDSLSITAIEDSTGTLVTPVTGTPITLASGATVTLNADGRLSYEAPAVDIVVTEVADDQAWTHAISETGSDESYDAKTITYTGLSGYSQGSLSLTLSVDGTYDDSIAIDLDGDGVIDYIVTEEDFRSSGAVGYTPWTDASPLSFEVLVTTTGTTVVTTWDGVVITPGAGGAPVNGPGHGGGFDNVSGFTLETLGYNPDGTVPSDDFTTSQIRLGTLNDGGPSESGISFAIQINNLVVEDTFDYRIDDGNGGTDIATVTVEVDPLNQAPGAVDDEYSINEGEPFTATLANGLLLNDTDLEGDTLTVNTTPVSGPSNGVLVLSADGTFTYTPNDGFMGRDSFTYEVNDGNGGVSSAVATILIDNDRDGYTNDIDFDDDNDGILDTEECLAAGDGIDHTGHSHSLPIIDSLYNGIVDPIADAVLFDHDAYGIFVSGSGLIAGGNTDGRGFIDSGWYKATGGHYEEDTNFSGTTFSNGTVSVSSFAPSLLGVPGTSSAATLGTTDTVTSSGDADADLVSGDSGTGLAIETASSLAAPAVTTVSIDFTDPVYSFGFDLNDLFDAGVLQGVLPTVTIEIDGDTVLRFVGADVLAGGGSLSAAVRDSDDNLVLGQNGLAQVVLVGNNTETFIGFTSPTPVSQVQINYGTTLLSLTVDEIGLDNFRYSTTPPCDIDGDGIGNRLDLDSDGDGVFEVDEASGVDLDLDNDGMVDGAVDANGVPIAASGGLDPDGGPSNPYDDSSVPPIVIDMDGDGVEFNSIDDGILLDVDGDGELERTAWANEDDAVLIFDGNDNGKVDGPDEFAFARYSDDPNATDLDGLRAGFDSDGDLILTAEDDEWANFKLWQDADGDGQVGEGELFSLDEAGIESIGLTSDGNSYSAADGDVYVHGEAVVNYADGSTGTAADSAFDFRELLDESDDDALEVMSESGEVVNLDESDFPEVLGSPVVDQGDIIVPEGSPNASVDELAANEAAMQ